MKYNLIIDKTREEEIIAIVKAPSTLTEQIENLVLAHTGITYIKGRSLGRTAVPRSDLLISATAFW